ncbi:monocarboxylate transporter 10-like [Orbicella faveolata]|uniref:monocarboxylate transporter 10-like n=1 Tax=Orbicella faveolata TaxID=48498 RepID=UPI0009E1DB1B|nr:monocarboxylate transporter 10-like [Orbicella faveolata]XP_020603964.1 monocarboxylate transporter 10-like [Orbicella faveolata]
MTVKSTSCLHLKKAEDTTETGQPSQRKLRQPDTWWSWVVCAAGVTCNIIVIGCTYCFGIIFPSLLDEFKAGKSKTAWVGSLAVASAGLFGPVAGRLTDRFGARAVVISGAVLSTIGLLLTSLVPSLYLMLLTYGGIFGCGSSLVYIAVFEIVPRYFVKRRSLATGLVTMSTGAGLLVMSPVCQVFIDAFGWRGAFRGMTCIVFIIPFIGWVLDPNVASDQAERSVQESEESKAGQRSRILDLTMWKNITFVVLNITYVFVYISHSIPPVLLARYCEDRGIAADLVTWLYSSIGLASLVARILGSKLCDVMSPPRVFLIFATVATVATMMLPLATNWMWLLCYCIAYGLADGLMTIGIILSGLQTLTQKQKAQGFGFQQLCISTAFLYGPPIGGKPQRWNTLIPSCNKIKFGQKSIK